MKLVGKKYRIAALVFCIFGLLAQSLLGATITYQEDSTTDFKNPERGVRSDGSNATLGRIYFELGSYKGVDNLPQSVFDRVANDCKNYREDGRKLIVRFRYFTTNSTDAPLDRILKHIEQLGPVLKANADVIALFESGFIGCWGEWHHQTCGSSDVNNLDNTAARKAILFKQLEHWPQDRMIIIRYNNYKRQIYNTNIPLGPDSAFSGSFRARTGAMNDCFRYDKSDRGTYDQPPYTETVEYQKTFLNLDNRYVPQEGESCGSSSYSVCDSAIKDLQRMHWDALSISSFTTQWSSGGCLNKILRNFGYRLALRNARFQDSARPGNVFTGTINLQNVGWGKIYNPRGCELVLRNGANKFVVKLANDPRRWCMTDSVVNVSITAPLPTNMPEGLYQVLLHLPDPYPSIHDRKEYSIRLANKDIWEDATGYNLLQHSVMISNKAPLVNVLADAAPLKGLESVRVKKLSRSIEFTLPQNRSTPVTLEIYSLSGSKVWSRTVMPREGGVRAVAWTGASSGVYLWKASSDDRGSSHTVTGVIPSLLVNRN